MNPLHRLPDVLPRFFGGNMKREPCLPLRQAMMETLPGRALRDRLDAEGFRKGLFQFLIRLIHPLTLSEDSTPQAAPPGTSDTVGAENARCPPASAAVHRS